MARPLKLLMIPLLTWRNFRYDRGSGDAVNAQIELFRNGDFVVRSNTVERTFSRIVPFDFDGDGLSNDIDAQPYVYNGDHRGQTAQKREGILGEVGVGLENGWYYLSAIFPERPHCPTLVSVGTNRLVVVEAGEYLFLLEKGIEYDICVEPKRDDVIYEQGDKLFGFQPLGTANISGIIVRGMINATTLAHEIGHLCNWKDIYCYGSKFAAENLDVQDHKVKKEKKE